MRLIGRSSKDSLVPFGGKSALVLQKYKVTDLVEIEDDIVAVASGQRARLHDARSFTDRGPVAKVLVQKKIRRKVACELEGVAVVGAVAVGDVADMRKPGEFSYSRQLVVVIDASRICSLSVRASKVASNSALCRRSQKEGTKCRSPQRM